MKTTFRILVACFIIAGSNYAQTLKVSPKLFNIIIEGTTNVHDYVTKVTQVSGDLVFNNSNQVQSLVVTIPVKSIKSKEKLMDTKTYEAFNADTYPIITFKLLEVNSLQVNGSDISATVTGNLTMNGTTKKILLKSSGKNVTPGSYQFKGAIALKMSEFKMKAPTAMLGLMKVGDAITVKYDVTFEGQQLTLQ